MSLFKSREERRLDREVEIRKGINLIKRNIRDLKRNEKEYLEKAKKARQLGSKGQLEFLKKAVKRTAGQRLLMEKQLLGIETANQIKNQSEAHAQFAKAMLAVSRSIGEMFGTMDLGKAQAKLEEALAKAETMEERMNLFLDVSGRSLFDHESGGEEAISDAEIDELLDREIAAEESGNVDQEIQEGLEEIQKELGRE
jgi:hypothetical protein